MRKLVGFFAIILMIITPVHFHASAEETPSEVTDEFMTKTKPLKGNQQEQSINEDAVENREMIIQGNVDLSEFHSLGLELVETTDLSSSNTTLYTFKIPNELDYENTLLKVKELNGVENAEPNYKVEMSATPNDYYYSNQWYIPALDFPKSWNSFSFRNEVKVAVLDTGVSKGHEDLKGKVLNGYDFVNNDSDPADDHGHGTSVAGTIAAISNNRTGIAGINQNVKIIPVKVSDREGHSTVENQIKGIHYAIEQGADIINMSYGSYYYSDIENEALWEAFEQGITLIGAAGNDTSREPMYPATYLPVISVAATDQSKALAYFSNRGEWIDLAAPGEDMYSLHSEGGYSVVSGTSFSAPVVAGMASLLLSERPDLTPREVEWLLELGANGSWKKDYGYGIPNMYKTLTTSLPVEEEVSGTTEGAFDIGYYEYHSEKMNFPYDYDVYVFHVDSNTDVDINLTGMSNELDLSIDIEKLEGSTLEMVDYIDEYGLGKAESYSFLASPGTYYVIISDYHNRWSSTPYQLSVISTNQNVPLVSPTATVPSGKYTQPFEVKLSSTSNKRIVYTLDGSTPSSVNGLSYVNSIPIYESTTIKAAVVSGTATSDVSTFTYELNDMLIPNLTLPVDHDHPSARVIIRRDGLGLYRKNSDNTFTYYRGLTKGEQLKVFGVSGHYYNVGGEYYVRHQEGKTIAYIGRALIKEPTPLYDPNGNVYRMLQKGEAIKVYSYNDQKYEVGGGYTIKADKKSFYLMGYVKPKKDIVLYAPNGARHSTLKKGNLYYVKSIGNGKVDLGNGYFVVDRKEDFYFIKN
ncbi:S8 family serine peptidase [Metabacillus litoralis]|uniref:S8 family serine peptidase n=1 Tax=Metabacillus litoralis TaxID=152268 RepID=UPI000EF626F6|nr:S8 family serine peptidase [Metabacillus litoralis]